MNFGKKLVLVSLFLLITGFLLLAGAGIVKSDFPPPPPPPEEEEPEEESAPATPSGGDSNFGIAFELVDWPNSTSGWRAVDYQPFRTVIIINNVSSQIAWTAADAYQYAAYKDVIYYYYFETENAETENTGVAVLIYQRADGSYYWYRQKFQGPHAPDGPAKKEDVGILRFHNTFLIILP